jgi:acetyl-CoA carboxylase carboxyltransferase component
MNSSEKMAAFLDKIAGEPTGLRRDKLCDQWLSMLFDPDSFVSLDSKVVSRPFSDAFDRAPVEGDGVVTGYGTIGGRLVFAAAQDPDVYGGSMGRSHSMKIVKSIEMAIDSNAPFVALFSSGGARIEEGVLALEGLGAVLSALNEAKGMIPVLSAIMGQCPGGLAIAAVKADFLFMIEKKSGMYINSPSLSSIADAMNGTPDNIGSAETHKKTGLASFILPTEDACIDKIREVLEYIPVAAGEYPSVVRELCNDDPNRVSEALNKMASESDMNPILADAVFKEISDRNQLIEIGSDYGKDIFIALGKLDGVTVGFIGNRAQRMTSEGVKKAARFVRFCDSFMIPMVTLTNSEGFELGSKTESSSVLEDAASLIDAFASSSAPRIGILAGKAIGTAYLCLNSKMLGADIVYAWPTAEVSVLSADAAAHILFREKISGSENPIEAREKLVSDYRDQIGNAEVAASLGQVDEIIVPSATRPRVISALDILLCSRPLSEK